MGYLYFRNTTTKIKKTCICILALLISMVTVVYAVSNEKITALLNREVSINYNAIEQNMSDANGDSVYPISYDGTTYLPIRAICDMLGIDIEWSERDNSISVTDSSVTEDIVLNTVDFKITVHSNGDVILDRYHGTGGNVVIPDGVTEIGKGAFDGVILGENSIKIPMSVYIPDSVVTIGDGAFFAMVDGESNGLTEIRMSSNICEIGENAFAECDKLQSVWFDVVPTHEIHVGYNAFAYCTALERCDILDAKAAILEDNSFIGTKFSDMN